MASHQKAKGISATLSPSSTKPADPGAGVVPENLYHTTLTVIDHHATTCGATTCLQVLGTHTTLKDAKAFAYHDALRSLNYQPYDFAIYATRENFGGMPPPGPHQKKRQQVPTAEAVATAVAAAAAAATKTPKPTTAAAKLAAAENLENESTSDTENNDGGPPPPEVWPYGDEVLVYAKARAGGQEFLIGVVEKPNTEHLASAGPMYGNVPLLPSHKTPSSKFQSKARQPLGAAAGLEAEAEAESDFDETEELSYVIQTKTDYNQALAPGQPDEPDEAEELEPEPTTGAGAGARRHHHPPSRRRRRRRSSSITRLFQACEIEGCFPHKRDAVDFARRWLDTQKESGMFVQYDEREQLPRSFFLRPLPTDEKEKEEEEEEEEDTQQWPFGEDVLVHAVASTGENYCVAVRTVKGAKERFGKKVPRRGGREVEMDSLERESMGMGMEVPRVLVREEGMEETMKGREEKWRMSYYEDVPTKIGT
ncbi:hypothetical protein GE21DRAFT_10568 [Neurospora crassa]|uniref:Uncharacterized protein n=1 Tax=Neurospora crassa (strain ATCC 24698 / 74-OR23-1A / CBS 708.71 / DSM 1257 / FGSC 987) TaxID=367110 RepID=Q7S494_NEUCR|nr:hypothetical protein NCU08154 [Neurospora crassa OR74A]EAA30329.2 hypothetical protein NCU08154 [Neurospora crassa OR74A]KHE79213.1 hypothetical protein GE21DRAFT_10568 [Neurospora crassa]|eukprot:XP_959565.2 hypothetical protein NCU08154 [Neurospora crassa OR74A]